ncbi:hypothetical protein LCGC14_2337510, partial [marine sediment metagenome]
MGTCAMEPLNSKFAPEFIAPIVTSAVPLYNVAG